MIRAATHDDHTAIRGVIDAAFAPSVFESRLYQLALDKEPQRSEWVVERQSRIVAHILYTPAYHGAKCIGHHLAPVAVHPDFQKQGIGSELIRATIDEQPISASSVFVLGDPRFYERFGFISPRSARCAYDPEGTHFRTLREGDTEEPFEVGYSLIFQHAEKTAEQPGMD